MIPAGSYQVHPCTSQQRISRAQRRGKNTLVIETERWREPAVYLRLACIGGAGEGHGDTLVWTRSRSETQRTCRRASLARADAPRQTGARPAYGRDVALLARLAWPDTVWAKPAPLTESGVRGREPS